MARKQREEFPGAVFHLWFRRLERWTLFADTEDYEKYVGLLASTVEARGWILHDFCLMPNHIHLLIEISEPNLGAGLRDLHRTYVRWFNDRHGRSGRLFEHRPQWKAVKDDIYYVTLRQYIAHNPVEGGLCSAPDAWEWSRTGWIAKHGQPSWLATKEDARELKDGTRFRL